MEDDSPEMDAFLAEADFDYDAQTVAAHEDTSATSGTLAASWGVRWRRPPPVHEPNPQREALVFQQLEIDHYIGVCS